MRPQSVNPLIECSLVVGKHPGLSPPEMRLSQTELVVLSLIINGCLQTTLLTTKKRSLWIITRTTHTCINTTVILKGTQAIFCNASSPPPAHTRQNKVFKQQLFCSSRLSPPHLCLEQIKTWKKKKKKSGWSRAQALVKPQTDHVTGVPFKSL